MFSLNKIITKPQWASEDRQDYDENTPEMGQVPSMVGLHSWKRLILQKCGCSLQWVEVITIYPPQLSEAEQTDTVVRASVWPRWTALWTVETPEPTPCQLPQKKIGTNKQLPHWIKFSLIFLMTDIFL